MLSSFKITFLWFQKEGKIIFYGKMGFLHLLNYLSTSGVMVIASDFGLGGQRDESRYRLKFFFKVRDISDLDSEMVPSDLKQLNWKFHSYHSAQWSEGTPKLKLLFLYICQLRV